MDLLTRQVLEIVVRSRNEAAAGLRAASADVTGLQAALASAGHSMISAGTGLGLAAAGAAAGMGVLVKTAADFESSTQTLANNTNMGAAGLAAMRDQSLSLADATGQAADSIAQGYMYIANHAYAGAAAQNILAAATKNAAATNGVAGDNANVLAGILREYNVSQVALAQNTQLATRYMDVLHNAVANSNFTMQDFVEGGKRAFAQAGAFSVPISQVSAQLAILSEHGFPSAEVAGLNWAGMLRSLEGPTDKARKGMAALHQATGVDLLADVQKLKDNGAFLPQFLQDIATATGGDFTKMMQLMPRASYAQALSGLVRNLPELTRVQGLTGAAEAGVTVPGMTGTDEAFAAQQTTLMGKMDDLRQSIHHLAVDLGTALMPAATSLLAAITPLIGQFSDWARTHADLIARVVPLATALAGLAATVLTVGGAAALFIAALNPVSIVLMAVVGAVGALGIAWATNWGGIRETLASAWMNMQTPLAAIRYAVGAIVTDFRTLPLGDALRASFTLAQAALGHFGDQFTTWMNGVAAGIKQHTAAWAAAFANWIAPVTAGASGHMNTYTDALMTWVHSDGVTAMVNLGNAMADALSAAIVASLKKTLSPEALWHAVTSGGAPGIVPTGGGLLGKIGSNPTLAATGEQVGNWDQQIRDWFNGVTRTATPPTQRAPISAGHQLDALTGVVTMTQARAAAQLAAQQAAHDTALNATIADQVAHIHNILNPVLHGAGGARTHNPYSTLALEAGARDAEATASLPPFARGLQAAAQAQAAQAALPGAPPTSGAPAATTTPGLTGLGGSGGSPTIINVTVSSGAVSVNTSGGPAPAQDYAIKIGKVVADALGLFAKSEQAVTPGAPMLLPGARSAP